MLPGPRLIHKYVSKVEYVSEKSVKQISSMFFPWPASQAPCSNNVNGRPAEIAELTCSSPNFQNASLIIRYSCGRLCCFFACLLPIGCSSARYWSPGIRHRSFEDGKPSQCRNCRRTPFDGGPCAACGPSMPSLSSTTALLCL